jgi:hypothetical protein
MQTTKKIQIIILVSTLGAGTFAKQSFAACDPLEVAAEHEGKTNVADWRLEFESLQREMRLRLNSEARSTSPQTDRIRKETYSLDHQQSLIDRLASVVTRVRSRPSQNGEGQGRDFKKDLESSIADSDKGKLKEYQDTIWNPSTPEQHTRSNAFFDLVALRPSSNPVITEAQKILQEVLIRDFDGRPGEGLHPSRFSNNEIRSIVQNNFFLAGGLHDHPGIYDAFLEFAAYRDSTRFRNRLRYNISHNGPGRNSEAKDGFWGMLFNVLIPGQLNNNGVSNYFEGTIYWRNGKIRYPEGSSVGWFLHTASDRLSGEINLLKFMAELSREDMINTLATSYNASGVIGQLEQLNARLIEVRNRLNPEDYTVVSEYIASLSTSQKAYANALQRRLQFAPATNGKVDRMEILNEGGQAIARYEVDRSGGRLLRNGDEITREEFFEKLSSELFAPVRHLDPLRSQSY